ncbi:MAG: TonB-dependent receptor [Pseudomonadota bacterium]
MLKSILYAGSLLAMTAALSATNVSAQDGNTYDIAIEPQPLGAALNELSRQTGVLIVAPATGLAEKTAPALEGTYQIETAMAALLASSDLEVQRTDTGAFIVAPQASAAPMPKQGRVQVAAAELPVENLIITGTKRNLSLQQTQTSVELFDPKRIEREVLVTLDDILLRTPNVSALNAQTNFSIRGIAQGGVGGAGTGQTSNIYVDGAPLTTNGQQGVQSLWDIAQVEVLRGPQSTIQGRNALAGAIVMQTADPTYEWEVRGRFQIATQETYRASAVVSGPILADQLAFRLAFDWQDYDAGVTEVTTGIPQEFQESFTYRGKILIEPAGLPGFRAEFKAEHINTDFGEFNTRFAPVPFDDPEIEDFDEFGNETFTRVRLETANTDLYLLDITQEIGEHWTVYGIGAYENQDRTTQFCDTRFTECNLITAPTRTDQYSGELRAQFDYGRFSGWFGGYYFNQDIDRIQEFTLPVIASGFVPTPLDSTVTSTSLAGEKIENIAIFADFTFKLNEKWSFNIGARYDWEDFTDEGVQGEVTADPQDCTLATPFGVIACSGLLPVPTGDPRPADFSAFLPRAGITYSFDELRSLSLVIQRGYRAGGSVFQQIDGVVNNRPFDPEYIWNYELAFRSQWLDERLTINANAFYTDWNSQQVSIPGPSGQIGGLDAFIENAGESRLFGLEVSTAFEYSNELQVFGSLGLLDTEFTDFPFGPEGSTFANLAGNEFPAAPTLSASAGFNYEHPIGAYTSWNISYQSGRESEVANVPVNSVGGYVLVNARLGYSYENFNVFLFANNLFNDRFSTSKNFQFASPTTGELAAPLGNARFQTNEPRVAGISIEASF